VKGDFSRLLSGAPDHYVGVLHQQGRVWLDSDWNEDVADRLELLAEQAADVIGGCGVPDPGTAFAIAPNPDTNGDPADFQISGGPGPAGRYYVDGITAKLDQTVSYLGQPDYPGAPPIVLPADGTGLEAVAYLQVWQRLVTYLEDDSIREIALNGPDTATRIKTIAQVKVATAPAGAPRLTCTSAAALIPGPGQGTLTTLQPADGQPDDPCRIPDAATYTGRENHLYRVEIHDGGDVAGEAAGSASTTALAQDAPAGSTTLTLDSALTGTQLAALQEAGVLRVTDDTGNSETATVSDASPSTVTLAAGLSNGYTAAAHARIIAGVARFKWSRDNASVAVRVTAVNPDRVTLTVASLGRDQATLLRQGDLVEVEDDTSDLGPARGLLTFLTADPDPDQLTVTLADPLSALFDAGQHLVLRRWDGSGWAQAAFDPVGTPDMDLGDGVHIQLGGFDLQPGDYWQFTARTTDGSVQSLTDAPPAGIIRHACPLAALHWTPEVVFAADTVFGLAEQAGMSGAPLDVLAQELTASGLTLFTSSMAAALAQEAGATPDQLTALTAELASSNERQLRQVLTVDDCRQQFEPLTKQEQRCECSIIVEPGQSLSAGINALGPEGGIVCLMAGRYELPDTVTVVGRAALTIQGAGTATVLRAPASGIAFNFQQCDNLTLRDLTISSGLLAAAPPGTGNPAADVPPGAVSPFDQPELFEGAITLVSCREATLTRLTVTVAAILGSPSVRTCITCQGTLPAPSAPVTTVVGAAPAGTSAPVPSPPPAAGARPAPSPPAAPVPTAPTVAQAAAGPALPEDPRALALTVRDCRLLHNADAAGLLVTDTIGVTVDGTWFSAPAPVPGRPGLGLPEVVLPAQRAYFALALINTDAVTVTGNRVVGVNVAAFSSSDNLILRDNAAWACDMGIIAPASGSVSLAGNKLQADNGPGLYIAAAAGQVTAVANTISGKAAPAVPFVTLPPILAGSVPAACTVIAQGATLSANTFRAGPSAADQALDLATFIQAPVIEYHGNRSVCATNPAKADVALLGSAGSSKLDGAVTAVGNVCEEPLVSPAAGDAEAHSAAAQRQYQVLSDLLAGRQAPADAEKTIAELNTLSTPPADAAGAPDAIAVSLISLIAAGATAVTGMNLLSHQLIRQGQGTDTGTVIGVP
jgi:hypothetical protein